MKLVNFFHLFFTRLTLCTNTKKRNRTILLFTFCLSVISAPLAAGTLAWQNTSEPAMLFHSTTGILQNNAGLIYLGCFIGAILMQFLFYLSTRSKVHLYFLFTLFSYTIFVVTESPLFPFDQTAIMNNPLLNRIGPVAAILSGLFAILTGKTKFAPSTHRLSRALLHNYIVLLYGLIIWVVISGLEKEIHPDLYLTAVQSFPFSIVLVIVLTWSPTMKKRKFYAKPLVPSLIFLIGFSAMQYSRNVPESNPFFLYLFFIASALGAFSMMVQIITNSENIQYFAVTLRRQLNLSKLSALQNRISSHFLFNSLSTIYAMFQNQEKTASQALINLADLYRFLAKDAAKSRITFQEEWNFMESFIRIMKARMGERLKVQLNFNRRIENYPVPPLTLQPIVENCFQHNLNPEHTLEVEITVRPQTGGAIIIIADNGSGFRESAKSNTLDNIRERLGYYYRSVTITRNDRPGGGAKVILSFADYTDRKKINWTALHHQIIQWLKGETRGLWGK